MPLKTLNFITGNTGKLGEVRAILGNLVVLQSHAVEIDEIQGTIEEIAKDKCWRASMAINGPALTEDTALEFRAPKGLPGPYIKWFLGALHHEGLNKLVEPYEDKGAEAVCTFALSTGPRAEPIIFQGRTRGKIVPARGQSTFSSKSWDPIFEYDGQIYAEMGKEAKNKISHRSKALDMLK
ncbi:non-canonical purine NTP pyrophosphatase, rdgB/HAM1 family [Cadophora sp. DSE1049]|nr:non-canonical purine NTP pyrophosphatase, rdgB/HAM1 family [Cadophora sp. DSE1049]